MIVLLVVGTLLCWLIFFIFDGIPPRQEAAVYVPEPEGEALKRILSTNR